MYTEDDLDAAVRRGDISAEGAAAIRRAAAARQAGAADGERLRLVSGFQDVSVAGAALLTLACLIALSASAGIATVSAIAAATAWGLAEHFSRARRLALTSIVLALVIVVAAGALALGMSDDRHGMGIGAFLLLRRGGSDLANLAGGFVGPLTAMAAASLACWLRFRVPAAMGLVAATAAGLAFALLVRGVPAAAVLAKPLVFAAGVVVFAFAMRWDLSDPARRSVRSDVAFWLHLAAAPMIVGPAFAAIGAQVGAVSPATAAAAIGLYVALSLVALAVDRRALMASALFYLLAAVGSLMATKGAFVSTLALTGLAVGPALLLLFAAWTDARRAVLARLPERLARRLRPLPPVPASAPAPAA